MELDLKTRKYKILCDKLDKLKENKIDPNDERLLVNHDDIVEINRQIKEIKEIEEHKEKQKLEQYNPENIFNKKNDTSRTKKEEDMNMSVLLAHKESFFSKIISKIKLFFHK